MLSSYSGHAQNAIVTGTRGMGDRVQNPYPSQPNKNLMLLIQNGQNGRGKFGKIKRKIQVVFFKKNSMERSAAAYVNSRFICSVYVCMYENCPRSS